MQAQVDGQGSVLIRQHVKCRSVGNDLKLVSSVDDIKGVLQTTISQHASMSVQQFPPWVRVLRVLLAMLVD